MEGSGCGKGGVVVIGDDRVVSCISWVRVDTVKYCIRGTGDSAVFVP